MRTIDLSTFVDWINSEKNIQEALTFQLSSNDDHAEGIETLTSELKPDICRVGDNSIELELRYNNINPKSVQVFAEALKSGKCPNDRRICLECSDIDAEGIKALASALESGNCPAGFTIDLACYDFSTGGLNALTNALESGNCPDDLRIYLCNSKINLEGIKALASALKSGNCPDGFTIDLSYCRIDAEGIKALVSALESGNCPDRLYINLSSNHISAKDAEAIAKAVGSGNCPNGLQINLSFNRISTEGAEAIAKAVESGNYPNGLRINLENNDAGEWPEKINGLIRQNDRKRFVNTMLACVTLLQGHRGDGHMLSTLPTELLFKIFSYLLIGLKFNLYMKNGTGQLIDTVFEKVRQVSRDSSVRRESFMLAQNGLFAQPPQINKRGHINERALSAAINDILDSNPALATINFSKGSMALIFTNNESAKAFHQTVGRQFSSVIEEGSDTATLYGQGNIDSFIQLYCKLNSAAAYAPDTLETKTHPLRRSA